MILAAANTYLGLFAGLTIASAIPAAVVSMGMLGALGRAASSRTTSCLRAPPQGARSPRASSSPFPRSSSSGYWQEFDYWWVLAIGGLGGLLGVLFSVPLRRSLIVEQNMSFPEGQAAAEVLRAGENPSQGAQDSRRRPPRPAG